MRSFAIMILALGLMRAAEPAVASEIGSVTNLPIPRFVSLKAGEGNARRGPSLNHRIDWVFMRRDMPLEVVGEFGHWRRVRDSEGFGGWIHRSLLSGARTVIVEEEVLPLLLRPDPDSPVNARAEAGVVAKLGKCTLDWCRIGVDRHRGWVPKTAVWGVGQEELRD